MFGLFPTVRVETYLQLLIEHDEFPALVGSLDELVVLARNICIEGDKTFHY